MSIYTLDAFPLHIDAGAAISKLCSEPGTTVLLKQCAQFQLLTPIFLTDDCTLATEGYPVHDELKARLLTVGNQAEAIHAAASRVRIKNLVIDGCEPQFGRADGPLLFIGGQDKKGCIIQDCLLTDTRGWTCCHLFDHGEDMRVLNNRVVNAGRPAPAGPWADGISCAASSAVIAGNTIIDATDGAIVLFCAPGTIVTNNTIIARNRALLGGINLVDFGVNEGDYSNTRVFGNRIQSEGAFIKLAIGLGAACWGDSTDISCRGAIVEDNHLITGTFGYGFAAAGCSGVTIKANTVSSSCRFEGNTTGVKSNAAPCPFLRSSIAGTATGVFQPEFRTGYARFLIGVEAGRSKQLCFYPGMLQLDSVSNPRIELQDASLEVTPNGNLALADKLGQLLWTSGSGSSQTQRATAVFTADGQLIVSDASKGTVLYNPTGKAKRFNISKQSKANLVIGQTKPFLALQDDGGNLVFASSYSFPLDWCLLSGSYVAISAGEAPTYLYLDPTTARLILHSDSSPTKPKNAHWESPNWSVPADARQDTRAVLQTDGNLVIYSHGQALWASASNGRNVQAINFHAASESGGARIELCDGEGRIRWSSG